MAKEAIVRSFVIDRVGARAGHLGGLPAPPNAVHTDLQGTNENIGRELNYR